MLRKDVPPVLVLAQTSVDRPAEEAANSNVDARSFSGRSIRWRPRAELRVIVRYALIGIGLGVTIFTLVGYVLRFKLEWNLP